MRLHKRLPDFLLTVCILGFYFKLVSHNQFNFVDTDTLKCVFDEQAKSFLNGRLDMPPDVLKWEGFHVNGKTYTYWGIWLALLRIPGLLFIPDRFCQWAKPSVLLASFVFLMGIWANLQHALKGRSKNLVRFAVVIFSLGTSYQWLLSLPNVYHEVISWALAASVWALFFFFRIFECERGSFQQDQSKREPAIKYLIGLSSMTALCLFTRPTYSFPWYGFIFIYSVLEITRHWGEKELSSVVKRVFAISGIAAMALVIQLSINNEKWGSPFIFLDLTKSDLHMHDPRRMRPLVQYGYLNIKRVPDTVSAYLGVGADHFSKNFPFVKKQNYNPEHWEYFDGVEPTVSLTLTNFWLFVAASLGFVCLIKKRYSLYHKLLAVLLMGLAITPFFLWAIIQRYVFELFPALFFLSFLGVSHLRSLKEVGRVKLGVMMALLFISLWFSSWCTVFGP